MGLLVLFIISLASSGGGPSVARTDTLRVEPPPKPAVQAKADYMAQVNREVESLRDGFDGSGYRDTKDAINLEIALFGTWGKIISEAHVHSLSDAEKAKVAELRRLVSQVQAREFPRMRAAWAGLVKDAMWQHDMTVATGGESHWTLRLTAAMFASNSGIKQVQETIHEQLSLLRFRRVEFRWYRGADEFSHYAIDGPRDGDVRQLSGAGWAAE